jgi:hypothetical protein
VAGGRSIAAPAAERPPAWVSADPIGAAGERESADPAGSRAGFPNRIPRPRGMKGAARLWTMRAGAAP